MDKYSMYLPSVKKRNPYKKWEIPHLYSFGTDIFLLRKKQWKKAKTGKKKSKII